MPTEETLVLVKPDGVARGLTGAILARIEAKGYGLVDIRLVDPDTGEAMRITDAVGEQEAVKTFRGIQQNMKEIKEQVDDFKDALKK